MIGTMRKEVFDSRKLKKVAKMHEDLQCNGDAHLAVWGETWTVMKRQT